MERRTSFLSIFVTMMALGGCASVTSGTSQSVAVSTTPRQGAQCTLTNGSGSWTVTATPGAATVARAYSDLVVTCTTPDGMSGAVSIPSTTAGTAFGNILIGGIVGAAVDMSSGAAFEYPAAITVALAASEQIPPSPAPTATTASPTQPAPPAAPARAARSAGPGDGDVVCRVGQSIFPTSRENCGRAGGTMVSP